MGSGAWRGRGLAVRAGAALAGVAVAAVVGATVALADCGNTATAVLQGQWQYRATVTYSGGAPSPTTVFPQGSQSTDVLFFTSTCTAPGACSLVVSSTADPTSQVASPRSPVYTEGSFTPLTQSGSDYTATVPSGGFGGPGIPPCSPPLHFLDYTLRLHVAAAVAGANGTTTPEYVTGSEDTGAVWTCSGSTGVAGTHEHMAIDAVPAGHAFPASLASLCAPPTSAAAVVAATAAPAGAAPGNPQQSTISTALATPTSSFGSFGHAAGNALITLGIVLLITFPASLFNKTFEENYDDIRDILTRRFGWLRRLTRGIASGASAGRDLAVFAVVVLAGAAIGGLNDPKFGFNSASLKTYTAVILAVLFGVSMSTLVGYVYRRVRHQGVSARLTALPAGLVVAGLCVLTSRLTDFQPGYLYGVICGVAFATGLQARENGHVVALSSTVTLALGVVAWFIWVPVRTAADATGASALAVIAGDFLAAVFVGGLVGSVLGLVPLRFLPGGTLLQWSRAAWGVLFGLAVFGLLQVMLRPESSSVHTGTKAVVTAAVLFVLFGGVSVAFRLYFTRRARRRREVAPAA